jgi:hypothetical protein
MWAMDIRPIDPRDETWQIVRPRFRVYFWTDTASEEFELSGTTVHSAIEWAESRRGDRTYTLYACADVDGLGLICLAGEDPSAEG